MALQIREVVLYSRTGAIRRLPFRLGAVNVITGMSGTGKSALIPILDYCMGRSTFTVPEGVIRETVAWYAVLFSVRANTEVFIAKPAPAATASSQSKAMLLVGEQIALPTFDELIPNSNDAAVEATLSRELGISPNLHTPPAGQSRDALSANVSHTKFYLFQEQGLVASRDMLFFRQSEQYLPQAIRDTLPYLLGAVEEDQLSRLEEARQLRRDIKVLERDLSEASALVGGGVSTALALLGEARQVGLNVLDHDGSPTSIRKALTRVVEWQPTEVTLPASPKAPELRAEVRTLKSDLRDVSEALQAAKSFSESASGYDGEVTSQAVRLEVIGVLEDTTKSHACPFCGAEDKQSVPTREQLEKRLATLRGQLAGATLQRPHLVEHISRLSAKQGALRQAIREKERELNALEQEDARAEAVADQNSRFARTVGRVSLYLDQVPQTPAKSQAEISLDQKRARLAAIEKYLGKNEDEDTLPSLLNRISSDMTRLSQQMPFEHSEYPLRFDLKNLTVVADRPERPFPMQRMGSGQNWLVCHLVALLALHRQFRVTNRPVPGFLVLDQPSQVYFPSTEKYRQADGSVEQTALAGADIEAVQRMFNLLFEVCDQLKGQLQIVVLEHANLDSPRYQEALVEKRWDKTQRALVPPDWLS